jgi:2-dehydropantoate 2-reductase
MGKPVSKIKKNKVGIIGLGPVGMILASHFHDAGCEVAIYDTSKVSINKIRREGISLEEKVTKKVFVDHICSSFEEFAELGVSNWFFCIKAHQMPTAIEHAIAVKKLMSEEVVNNLCVISAQNGIDVETMLSAAFGESSTMRMVLNFAGNLKAANIVKVTFFNPPNYIASVDDSQADRAIEIANWLTSVELETISIDSYQLQKRVWEKTILNASLSALCGIGKFTMKEAMDFPDTLEIVEQLIQEAVEVAEAEKIKFEDDFIRKCLRYLKKAGHHFPSLAGDVINNRVTEIDYFNGKIVDYGRKHYLRTPLNLSFTNMVRALTHKNIIAQLAKGENNHLLNRQDILALARQQNSIVKTVSGDCFIGVDLGSAYTKFTVLDELENIVYQSVIQTLNRDRIALKHVIEAINNEFPVKYCCATGYGRKSFADADIIKTEINCAARGVSKYHPGRKNIIDIGGEDIKVIRCSANNLVEDFSLNDKCAAGTGAFLVEVAERAEISISEMSDLAAKSNFNTELNSFCTVFAKTEITGWLMEAKPVEDIARGIYMAIANRISKLRMDSTSTIYMIGGVVTYHHFLKKLLQDRHSQEIEIVDNSQNIVSLGAALIAKSSYVKNNESIIEKTELNTI